MFLVVRIPPEKNFFDLDMIPKEILNDIHNRSMWDWEETVLKIPEVRVKNRFDMQRILKDLGVTSMFKNIKSDGFNIDREFLRSSIINKEGHKLSYEKKSKIDDFLNFRVNNFSLDTYFEIKQSGNKNYGTSTAELYNYYYQNQSQTSY